MSQLTVPGLVVSQNCVFEGSYPALLLLRVLGLEMKGLSIDSYGESGVILWSTLENFSILKVLALLLNLRKWSLIKF